MATSLIGALRVVLGLDQASFQSGLTAAEASLKKTGQKMSQIGAGMTRIGAGLTLGVTTPLIAFGAKAAQAAQESAAATAQVESALTSMGNVAGRTFSQLEEQAKGLQALSTFDDDEIMKKVTANLLTFGNVSGQAFDRAQLAAVNLSARLGQDLQSSAIQLGKALNNPIKGVTALQRVGVSFTEAQKEQIKTLTEAGKTYEAQSIILNELEKQFSGAAEAARSAAPGQDTVDAYREFEETIGALVLKLLPPLTDLLTKILNLFNSMSPEMQETALAIGLVAVALGPVLTAFGALLTVGGTLLPLILKIGPAFVAIAGFITSTLVPALTILGRVLLSMLVATGPIGWLILAVTAVVTIWANWDKIGPIVQRMYVAVKTWVMDKMGAVFKWLGEKIDAAIGWFRDMYVAVVGNSYVPDMVKGIGTEIAKLQKNMVEPTQAATTDVKAAFEQLKTDVNSILRTLFPAEAAQLDYLKQVDTLTKAMKLGIITADRYNAALGNLKSDNDNARLGERVGPSFDSTSEEDESVAKGVDYEYLAAEASEASDNVQTMFDKMDQSAKSFSEGIAGSFSTAVEDIVLGFGSIGDVARGLLADLTQMFFREFVTKQIFSFLTTAIGGGGFGGGFAEGGTLGSGQWGIVGEEGPEIAYAGSGPMSVIPHGESMDMLSGGGQNVFNVNVNGAMNDRDARRTGKMIAAEAGREWDKSRRQGIVG